ncbi:Protein VPRBP [Armadillidium nasatum]|uniref:Protein VPRBP n=1 Tax=Armadillidium nasatum TaxID=96803 RepID=A0A5N5T3U7_9CRUS|nr:Protein VPRBP [Armadillidium nasatum]
MPSNKDVVQELQEILRSWEDSQSVSTNDPTEYLVKLCELFERETVNFLKQDPDPFDDRHPVTSKPECALGQILRALFKKDAFVTKLVNHYLRDTYFTGLGLHKSSTDLNTAACRLLLDLLHGLDIPQVFRDSETTVLRLYAWAEKADEPLRTYATGLLAAAMDIPDLATSFREQNAHLVPIILKRSWELIDDSGGGGQVDKEGENEIPYRPFAHLSEENNDKKEPIRERGQKRKRTRSFEDNSTFSSSQRDITVPNDISILGSPKNMSDSIPCDSVSPGILNSDCSNSSWAEMSSYIVGTFKMHPIDKETKEMFMLKYLRPVGEYQESLGHVYEHHALDLVFHFINIRHTTHARLSFEALRFLGSLLFHKKFCLEFVNMGGIQKLLQVPRPSLPADGVALCLWYLAYCEEAIERTCLLPDNILTELVRYALWLLECSHQSSRMHAVMFFGMVFKFRAILERFDEQDGLRKMLNILATLSIFQDNWDQELPDEPNEVMMWQTVKQVCLSIKSYFESHLALKVHQLQRLSSASSSSSSCSSLSSFQHSTPSYKQMLHKNQWREMWNIFLEHLPYKARWKSVEQFVSLKGLQILLRLVATVLNDSFTLNRTETAVSALDTLYVCSVMPSVQSAFCDKITIPAGDDLQQDLNPQQQEVSGYAILVACIPENCQSISSSPEVQKAALNVLINCLCAPIHRPGSQVSSSATPSSQKTSTPTPTSSSKKRISSSEEVIKKSWDCVRNSNGIMYLLNLLHKKVPITDADCIRGLACRALVGLARSDTVLMKEPILQDKRIEHVKFQRHALELIKVVSGNSNKQENNSTTDVSIQSIHKANVVAQTKISYNKKQLLHLIANYLVKDGFDGVASQLMKEANLSNIMPPLMGPPAKTAFSSPVSTRSINNKRYMTPGQNRQAISSVGGKNYCNNSMPSPSPSTPSSSFSPPVLNTSANSSFCKIEKPDILLSYPSCASPNNEPGITLDRIVVEYLTNQHALCENPVVTCPTFDLFHPHRCPKPKSVKSSPANFAVRYTRQMYNLSAQGVGVRSLNRKFIYSRYRTSHVFRPGDDDEVFLTCEFTPDDQNLLVGTTRGEVRIYNKYTDTVIAQETVHQGFVTSLVPHNSGGLMLTSCSSSHESALWSIKDNIFDNKSTFNFCHHAEFSNGHDRILGTMDQTAKLYDLNTNKVISEFTPKLSNHYKVNKAALDPSDDLLLTDGVLFDVRSGKQVHKFDKINPILNGIFHRNGLEIISSSEIWDLRTFHLLRTVPVLALCDVSFNHTGDVIFGIMVGDDETAEENAYETSFKTVDAADYASIATVDVRRIVSSLAINQADTQIAVVETDGPTDDSMESSVVRIYDIGMVRQEEDEALEDDDDDDMGSDEETDDSDQEESQNEFGDEERNSNQSDEEFESDVISVELNSSFIDEDEYEEEDEYDENAEEVQSEEETAPTSGRSRYRFRGFSNTTNEEAEENEEELD